MDKHETQIQRAEEAQRLLTSPMFTKAFDDTRAGILAAWADLPTSDTDNARDLHRMLKCLDRVRRCLEVHVDTGKLAAKELEGRKRLFSLRA